MKLVSVVAIAASSFVRPARGQANLRGAPQTERDLYEHGLFEINTSSTASYDPGSVATYATTPASSTPATSTTTEDYGISTTSSDPSSIATYATTPSSSTSSTSTTTEDYVISSTSSTSTTENLGEDCLAETNPPSGWSCSDWYTHWLFGPHDTAPVSDRQCAPAVYVGVQCSTGKERIHWKCGQAGVVESSYEYVGGDIEVGVGGEVQGVGISVTGSVEYQAGSTSEVTFQDGDGCGQCTAWWKHGLVCNKIWRYERSVPIYGTVSAGTGAPPGIIGYKCATVHKKLECTDTYGPSSATCNRDCD